MVVPDATDTTCTCMSGGGKKSQKHIFRQAVFFHGDLW